MHFGGAADPGLITFPRACSCDNPYNEYGHLTVDQHEPEKNRWLPYDPTCTSPELMAALRSTAPKTPPTLVLPTPPRSKAPSRDLPLPWLYGKTVLLFGDHVERYHSKDLCNFAGGAFETIDANHALSPARFLNGIDEKFVSASKAALTSRPTVCYIEQYNFMVVTVFHFGLANRIEFEHEHLLQDEHFYPPGACSCFSIRRPSPDLSNCLQLLSRIASPTS